MHTAIRYGFQACLAVACLAVAAGLGYSPAPRPADEPGPPRVYENRLTPIKYPKPLLADHPQFVEPVRELTRYEAPTLVDDPDADLEVRAWRFSYNARGIVEMPNRLKASATA